MKKLLKLDTVNFSEEIKINRSLPIKIEKEDIPLIEKSISKSIRQTISFNSNSGIITFYGKRYCCGHDLIEVSRKGDFLIFTKSYSTNNNIDKKYFKIIS